VRRVSRTIPSTCRKIKYSSRSDTSGSCRPADHCWSANQSDFARVTALVHTTAPDLDLDELLTTIDHHSQDELDETRDLAQAREQAERARLDATAEELGGLRRDLDQRQNTQPAAVMHAIATEHTAQAAEAAQRYIVLQLQREILSREQIGRAHV